MGFTLLYNIHILTYLKHYLVGLWPVIQQIHNFLLLGLS